MLEHILAATDLTYRSEVAIARALELSTRFKARITLLHVVEQDQPGSYVEDEIRHARHALQEEADRLGPSAGGAVTIQVMAGDPLEQIGDTASNLGAQLIVMGRHRRRPLRDLFTGTTVERVIWRGTHPVLMVKRTPEGPYHSIGVATDFSDTSATALQEARSLGLLDDARIRVIHARMPFAMALLAAHANEDAVRQHAQAEMQEARTEMQAFLDKCGRSDLMNRLYLDEGEPVDVLRAWVERENPDLLVMGTHGRSGISRLFLGSVAEAALRTLELDILAVPPRKEG